MTIEKIKAAYEAKPFKAFTIHLADGRVMPVPHPEFMWFFPNGRTILVAMEDGSYHVIDLLLVVSLGFDAKRKGPKRRRAA